MSNALAIGGVTAVLRDRLNDGLVNHNVAGVLGSTVTVSVLPPDRVAPADGTESSQLNLFLYQVTPNLGWRNEGLPSRDASGRHRLSNPPLAIDLHYLLSAYSGGDLHAEILLGYAMQLMHEYPLLTREMIRTALTPSPNLGTALPPALRALAGCGLADQVEQLKVTPQTLSTEEISKLWAATQSSYRPTAAYQVSVVLIEATQPTRQPLPVLSRGSVDLVSGRDRGVVVSPSLIPPLPTIEVVRPADEQTVMVLDATITLEGHHLDGTGREIVLANEKFGVEETLAAAGPSASDRMAFIIPAVRAAEFPAGVYDISARVVPPGESEPRTTNRLAAVLAPDITNLPQSVARVGGNASFTLTFTPELRAGQQVTLLLGQNGLAPQAFTAPTGTLDFVVENAGIGVSLARLRIDGIESPIVDRAATPPVFLDRQIDIT